MRRAEDCASPPKTPSHRIGCAFSLRRFGGNGRWASTGFGSPGKAREKVRQDAALVSQVTTPTAFAGCTSFLRPVFLASLLERQLDESRVILAGLTNT